MNIIFGQTIIDGTLRWYRHGISDDCSPFEEDGIGLPPENIRSVILSQDGEWDVMINNGENKSLAVKVIRELMKLDFADAIKLIRCLPGIAYTGTKTEAEWIKEKLKNYGVTSEIRKNEPTRKPYDAANRRG